VLKNTIAKFQVHADMFLYPKKKTQNSRKNPYFEALPFITQGNNRNCSNPSTIH